MSISGQWALRGEEAHFYEYCDQRRLVMQRCAECDEVVFPPRPFCPGCRGSHMEWTNLSGVATVETYSVEMRPTSTPGLEPPYIVAIVRLQEGPRMLTNILADPRDIEIDSEVVLDFRSFDGRQVPVFRLHTT